MPAADGLHHPRFPFLAQRLFNAPLAITADRIEMIIAALAQRLKVAQLIRIDGSVRAFSSRIHSDAPEARPATAARDRGYDTVAGVAIVGVIGTLVQKSGTLRPTSGITGYDSIRANLLDALENSGVRAIVLDVDSGGGETAGLFDLCDFIAQARRRKPIWAILSETAYSAAYAIASACSRVTVPRTGQTGSIGIIAVHVDMSRALEQDGFAVSLIHYGARKIDFAESKPLSAGARQRAQDDVDTLGGMFDALVARNRGLRPERVKAFQAATFMGKRGVRAGLADVVAAPDEAFHSLLRSMA